MHRQRPQPRPPGTTSRAGALVTVALALGLAMLLNAEALERTAEGLPLGWRRDAALAVMRPVADLGRATGLVVPRRELDRALGHEPSALPSPRPTPAPTPAPTPLPTPPAGLQPSAHPSVSPSPAAHRVPSHAAPLRIRIVGDSMAQATGQSLITLAEATGVAHAVLDFRFSSGLSRPDFFDWPGHLADVLGDRSPPEVVVVFFGANDAQGMVAAQGVLSYGSSAWKAEYAARVSAVMDQLTAAGASVYWVGQPIARSSSYSKRMATLDAIYADQAARHEGITYVDSWSHFTNADGRYSAYLPTSSGPRLMRLSDGIHLTRAGGDRLAAVLLAAVRHDWRLPP